MDKNKHLFYMRRLLRDIYSDALLSSELRFKGGTAAMFFYGLPRFSTDLDFNLMNVSNQSAVFDRLKEIVTGYGKLFDSAEKRFGPIVVLDYGKGERKLKIEVSNRLFDNHYDILDLASMKVPVMSKSDMLSHKLCAFRERRAPRDIFDVWYFLKSGWELNPVIVMERTGMDVPEFLTDCKAALSGIKSSDVMVEIGELLDDSLKGIVRTRFLSECVNLLDDYAAFPLLRKGELAEHTKLLLEDSCLLPFLLKNNIDPSTVSSANLEDVLSGKDVSIPNKEGVIVPISASSLVATQGMIPDRTIKDLMDLGADEILMDNLKQGSIVYLEEPYIRPRNSYDANDLLRVVGGRLELFCNDKYEVYITAPGGEHVSVREFSSRARQDLGYVQQACSAQKTRDERRKESNLKEKINVNKAPMSPKQKKP